MVSHVSVSDDDITIYFNVLAGNDGLADFFGNVHAHAGVITQNSTHTGDRKCTKDGCGSADSSILMTPLGNDPYSTRFHIRSYGGIRITDSVL